MTRRLSECQRGDRVRILRVESGRGARLHLTNLGVAEGRVVDVLGGTPFGGPVIVRNGDTEAAIGFGLAERILVEDGAEDAEG
ncbi:MAG: ferrous iron transport protein A [Deltaproteobacteria bacterium]|nr:ferrous iron transport protein A [Deltaproteobacteria bacterium]